MKIKNTTPSKEFQKSNVEIVEKGQNQYTKHSNTRPFTLLVWKWDNKKSRQKMDPNVMTIADIKNKIQNWDKSTFWPGKKKI